MTDSNYEKVKARRAENPDKVAAQARRYRAKHPDKIKVIKQRLMAKPASKELDRIGAARRRKNDPEGVLRRRLAFEAKAEAKKVAIAGRPRAMICEICDESGRTVFDHDHDSGEFRGWICDRCNKTLGMVKDDPNLLTALCAYLEAFSERKLKDVA